jgi:hypothetical protein
MTDLPLCRDLLQDLLDDILLLKQRILSDQVLESLAKGGVASRPEITDAAMAVRAECVMLNNIPYIRSAVSVAGDVLRRWKPINSRKCHC